MMYEHGNWKGLLQEVRKEMKQEPSICEKTRDQLPLYVDVYLCQSPKKADSSRYGLVRRHVDKCAECRRTLDELLEMARDPAALASDIKPSPLPAFVLTPEPKVPKPKRKIGTISVSLRNQFGKLLWQHDRRVELQMGAASAFRFRDQAAREPAVADMLLDKVEEIVNKYWRDSEDQHDEQQRIAPVSQAYDMFVAEASVIPTVSRIYALQYGVHEQQFAQIWTIVDEFSTRVCYPIYDIEFKVAAAFPGIQFDFSVIPDCGEETGSLVPCEADRLYTRPD